MRMTSKDWTDRVLRTDAHMEQSMLPALFGVSVTFYRR